MCNSHLRRIFSSIFLLFLSGSIAARGDTNDWIVLLGDKGLDAWKNPSPEWIEAESVTQDPANPQKLIPKTGKGIWVNGKGRTKDLVTKQSFGDIEAHIEFLIPKKSNSGVKFEGLYEIQIYDSFGVKNLSGSDCGGIYPRAEQKPQYHHIDKGVPPKTNAAKPPGEWQTLDVIFKVPRFDQAGNKTAHARFVKVVLNGELIHDNVEVPTPTGHAWRNREVPTGPLLLQADHGPVTFRNVKVRAYTGEKKK